MIGTVDSYGESPRHTRPPTPIKALPAPNLLRHGCLLLGLHSILFRLWLPSIPAFTPPNLVVQLPSSLKDGLIAESWAENFDETIVYIERVIAYWSQTFKSAETRYSTTEREALGAKEGLVKSQPFIEGEKVTLITDHAALQWANTYENSNRRLAAWGTVFSAYAPHLSIVHRPGRKHSNVDPLSRLYQAPPPQDSPARDDSVALEMNPIHIDFSLNPSMGKAAFMAFSIHDCLEECREASINT